MGHEEHGYVPPHSTPPAEEKGSSWGREDTIDVGNVVQDLMEEEDIQLMMLTTWGEGRGEGRRRGVEEAGEGWEGRGGGRRRMRGERRRRVGEEAGGGKGRSKVAVQMEYVQWNLRIKDTLGAEVLSSFQRLSFGGRFEPICNL